MSGDVVKRLREYADYMGSWGSDDDAALMLSAAAELERLRTIVDSLSRAVNNPGVNPTHHEQTMTRHRREWPTLWSILDGLRRTSPW